jgi:preprotein translocase subunit SecE
MEKIQQYFRESYNELIHKVTWPTWPNLQSTTVVVLVAVAIMALLIMVMDGASNSIMSFVYGLQS